jgi:hypothetical protein
VQWFALVGTANHSYEVTLSNVSAGTAAPTISVFRLTDVTLAGCTTGAIVTVRPDAGIDPGIVTLSLNLPSPGRRAVFTVTATDDYFVRVTNNTVGDCHFTMVASDTTLFNPLWSTFGGFETFYKIHNTTNNSCTVTLSLKSDADAAVASSSFIVNAGQTRPRAPRARLI